MIASGLAVTGSRERRAATAWLRGGLEGEEGKEKGEGEGERGRGEMGAVSAARGGGPPCVRATYRPAGGFALLGVWRREQISVFFISFTYAILFRKRDVN